MLLFLFALMIRPVCLCVGLKSLKLAWQKSLLQFMYWYYILKSDKQKRLKKREREVLIMAKAMTEFEKVMIDRDNMSDRQAVEEKQKAKENLYNILEEGGDYDDVEEMMLEEYGLEMDYIFDLL